LFSTNKVFTSATLTTSRTIATTEAILNGHKTGPHFSTGRFKARQNGMFPM